MFEPNIKCDYENCTERYLSNPNGWWYIFSDTTEPNTRNQLAITALTDVLYHSIINDSSNLEDEAHCCSIDHAVKIISRRLAAINEENMKNSIPENVYISDADIDENCK